MLVWTSFVACTAVILFAGGRLSFYGDVIAEKTGLGRTWIGVILMASITSLPELITGASSMLVYDVPDIAVGDVLGSCMFSLVILALLDIRQPVPISTAIHQGHVLSAAFGEVLLGEVVLALAAGPRAPVIGWIGLPSVVFLATYTLAMRAIFTHERARRAISPGRSSRSFSTHT